MHNNQLTVVAKIIAKKGQEAFVKSELLKLIDPTLAEKGCINYDFHEDNKNPAVFLFYENWESYKLWQQHMNSEHASACSKAIGEAVEEVIINEMTPLK